MEMMGILFTENTSELNSMGDLNCNLVQIMLF